MNSSKLKILYTNIGRGHPFYLDGIIEQMNRTGNVSLIRGQSDVFSDSAGISLQLWKLIRYLYVQGGQDSVISKLYARLRQNSDYNKPSTLLNNLGRSLREQYEHDDSPLLVAHPLLIALLRGRPKLFYQHGEIIAPGESIVAGADIVFVPLESTAEAFQSRYILNQIIVTGLCIEPSLVKTAADNYGHREKRLHAKKTLVGGFFSSGAEPKKHLEILTDSILSVVAGNGKAIAFVKNNGRFQRKLIKRLNLDDINYSYVDSTEGIPYDLPPVTVVSFNNRREEYNFVTRFFRFFDYFMAPSHERSNWAVGLGLPMFIVDPPIGPFSPLNREYLLKCGTSFVIENSASARQFHEILSELHWQGKLAQMASNGWLKVDIEGFKTIVNFFSNYLKKESL